VAEGKGLSAAAKSAGYSSTSGRQYASKLRQRPDVQQRIDELRQEFVNARTKLAANVITRDRQHYLSLLYDIGAHGKNEGARVRAIELAGMEECGMFVKRSENVSVSLELPALERMTAESLRSLGSKIAERLGQLEQRNAPKQVAERVATDAKCTPDPSINNANVDK
jgi:hypothetical protein